MSDGMTESRRQERLIRDAASALLDLEKVLDDAHDAMFGLPSWLVADLDEVLRRFGRVTVRATEPGGTDPR